MAIFSTLPNRKLQTKSRLVFATLRRSRVLLLATSFVTLPATPAEIQSSKIKLYRQHKIQTMLQSLAWPSTEGCANDLAVRGDTNVSSEEEKITEACMQKTRRALEEKNLGGNSLTYECKR